MQNHTHRCVLIIGVLILSNSGIAKSNPPTPRPSEKVQPPQPEPDKSGQQPQTDQRGTENSPIVVKITPPEILQKQSEQAAPKENSKSSAEWWTVYLTGLLAAIGVMQTFVFGIQARRLKQTIIKMDEIAVGQTKDMSDAIEQSSRSATAMEHVSIGIAKTADMNEQMFENQSAFWNKQTKNYGKIIGFGKILAIAAIAGAIVSICMLYFIRAQLGQMKYSGEQTDKIIENYKRLADATEGAQRARIAVVIVDIEGPWEANKETSVRINYINVGHDVAVDVRNHSTFTKLNVGKDFVFGETPVNGGINNTCNNTINESGGSLSFPDTHKDMWAIQPISANFFSEDIISRERVLIMHGCITYLSSDVLRLTGYCIVLGYGKDHATSAKTAFCNDGNFAR
jgi:hypothetical protein